jgi:hypothetical protein
MINKQRILIIIAIITGIGLLPLITVQGNSAPPPGIVWFIFEIPKGQEKQIIGAQIQGCTDQSCNKIDFVYQFGLCTNDSCIDSVLQDNDRGRLMCAVDRCRLIMNPTDNRYFRFVVNLGGSYLNSEVIEGLPNTNGDYETWRVFLDNNRITIDKDWKESVKGSFVFFLLSAFFSYLIELIVAGLFFLLVMKIPKNQIKGKVLIVLMINMITFPIVWFYFPSLITFSSATLQESTNVLIYLSVLFSAFLLFCFWSTKTEKSRIWAYFIVYIVLYSGWMVFHLLMSGSYDLIWDGWSPVKATIVSEVFAVLTEAVFLWFINRKEFKISQVVALSLLMNASSYLIGAFITGNFLY